MTIHKKSTLCAGVVLGLSLLGAKTSAQDNPQPEISIEPGLSAHGMITDSRRVLTTREQGRKAGAEAPIGRLSVPADRKGVSKVLGLKSLEVSADIEGMVARTTIKHVFENDTDSVLEGTFNFPLPEDAAVDRFAMTIHGETDFMEGSLVQNQQAHTIYTNLVYGHAIDPGVMEKVGPNMFRATIFPIEAHRTKTIVVSYLQALQLSDQDGYQELTYRFPLSGAKDLPPASRMKLKATLFGLSRDAEVGASHNPTLTRDEKSNPVLTSEGNGDAPLDKDWIVTIDPPAGTDSKSLIMQAHRPDVKKDGTFAITLAPSCAAESVQSLDAIFVVNTSAHRTAAEFEKMRAFVKGALGALTSLDRFAIVPFDITARPMPGGLLTVNDENIKKAGDFLEAIQPMGATDIAGAFEAVKSAYESSVQRHVRLIYIGDSEATYGTLSSENVQQSIDATLKTLNAEMYSIFTRNMTGSDLIGERARLSEKLQNFCGGNVVDLGGTTDAAQAGRELAAKLGMPMLRYAKLSVRMDDGNDAEVLSPPGGGLYLNQATAFFGRYTKSGSASLLLTGRFENRPFRQEWNVELPEKEAANAAIVKLWARSQMAYGYAHPSERGLESPLSLSLENHILGKETAFLVLENEEMYKQFFVEHNNAAPTEQELRAKFLAGSGDSEDVSVAPVKNSDDNDSEISVRVTSGLKLCSPLLSTVQVGGVDVEVSLQSVRVKQYQTNRRWPLLRLEQTQLRLGISRLLAAERGLPFEPETVYPEMWLKAMEQTPEQLLASFSSDADEAVWKIVQSQPVKVEPNAKPEWSSSLNNLKIYDEAEALVNPEKMSSVTFSADGTQMQLDSHLLAHNLFNRLIDRPRTVQVDAHPWISETRRVVMTRRTESYSLAGVSAERLNAGFNFLAQIALVEGQSKLSSELSARAIKVLKNDAVKHTFRSAYLTRGLASELRCDYAAAAASYQKMLEKTCKPLVRTGKELTYESLINTMSLAGKPDAAITVMERWRAEEGQQTPLTMTLAKAYFDAGRNADAIRAASSDCDFDSNIGKHFERPEDFLTLLLAK